MHSPLHPVALPSSTFASQNFQMIPCDLSDSDGGIRAINLAKNLHHPPLISKPHRGQNEGRHNQQTVSAILIGKVNPHYKSHLKTLPCDDKHSLTSSPSPPDEESVEVHLPIKKRRLKDLQQQANAEEQLVSVSNSYSSQAALASHIDNSSEWWYHANREALPRRRLLCSSFIPNDLSTTGATAAVENPSQPSGISASTATVTTNRSRSAAIASVNLCPAVEKPLYNKQDPRSSDYKSWLKSYYPNWFAYPVNNLLLYKLRLVDPVKAGGIYPPWASPEDRKKWDVVSQQPLLRSQFRHRNQTSSSIGVGGVKNSKPESDIISSGLGRARWAAPPEYSSSSILQDNNKCNMMSSSSATDATPTTITPTTDGSYNYRLNRRKSVTYASLCDSRDCDWNNSKCNDSYGDDSQSGGYVAAGASTSRV